MDSSRFPRLHAFLTKEAKILRKEAQQLCLVLGILSLIGSLFFVLEDYYHQTTFFRMHGIPKEDLVPGGIILAIIPIALGVLSWRRKEGRRYAMAGIICAVIGLVLILVWDHSSLNF